MPLDWGQVLRVQYEVSLIFGATYSERRNYASDDVRIVGNTVEIKFANVHVPNLSSQYLKIIISADGAKCVNYDDGGDSRINVVHHNDGVLYRLEESQNGIEVYSEEDTHLLTISRGGDFASIDSC